MNADRVAGLKVCVVGINYAPEETGIAPYTTGLARDLGRRGAEVQVLTGVPHYPQWHVPDEYRSGRPIHESDGPVRLIRLPHYVPATASAAGRARYEMSFGLAVARFRLPTRPDVVIGIVPSLLGSGAGYRLARKARAGFGLIVQDLMGPAAAQSGIPQGRAVASVAAAVEGWIARRAHGIAVVAPEFGRYLESRGARPDAIRTLRNWTHIDPPSRDAAQVRAMMGWPADATVVLHAGNMGNKQALEHVVAAAAVAQARGASLLFVLMGDGNQRAALEAQAAGATNVRFVDPQPRELLSDILAAADVLLLSERATAKGMSLPSKLTSYFAAGRPVVAAVPPGGTTATELERAGAGLVVRPEDPDALLAGIDELVHNETRSREQVRRGREYVETELSARRALDAACDFVADVAQAGRGRGVEAARWN